jgi:hypothetical protein
MAILPQMPDALTKRLRKAFAFGPFLFPSNA